MFLYGKNRKDKSVNSLYGILGLVILPKNNIFLQIACVSAAETRLYCTFISSGEISKSLLNPLIVTEQLLF